MTLRFGLCLFVASLVASGVNAQIAQVDWKPLRMDLPRPVRSAPPLGAKNPNEKLHLSLAIVPRDEKAMERFANDVSNPKSPNYRHFLSPEEVGARFGAPLSALKATTDYLAANGMNVKLVAKNRLSILAEGTVAQAEAAFHTRIQDFADPMPGAHASGIRFSYSVPPSVPAQLARIVRYVGGLQDFTRPIPRASLTPGQLRSLYSVASLYDHANQGQGRSIGISNWDGYLLSNVPLEYSQFSLPAPSGGVGSNITVVSIGGGNGAANFAQGEGDIDIQCALAVAPLSNLLIYDNSGGSDLIAVLTQEANDNKADLISESYGWTPDTALFESAHPIHVSMSIEGITYLAAAGDTGATGIVGGPYPDEDPEVLTVGGTSATVDGSGNRLSEVVWNSNSYAGGGGWIPNSDSMNTLPGYQVGNGVPTNIPYRLVPDISLDADPNTGYDIFYQGGFSQGWGGTSCASPTVAGALAVCEQKLIAAGYLTANSKGKYRMGRLQDLLYSYNGDPSVFHDIVSGDIGLLPDQTLAVAAPGWDFASGWGTPIFAGLVNRILGIPTPIAFTVSPSEVLGGTSVTGTLTINTAAPNGGFVVSLSADSAQAAVPATVTIPAGQTSTTFSFGTTGSANSVTANLAATASGISLTATLIINPSSVVSVSIDPNAIVGGNYALGTVTLNGPAPTGGLDVNLSSDNAAVTVPQHVEVPAGQTSGIFSVASSPVSATITATVTANYNGVSVTAGVSVSPPSFASLSVAPTSVQGGSASVGTVTMANPAPAGGFTVTLTSDTSSATVPATAMIPAGATSVTFKISTIGVTSTTLANITAANGPTSYTATLTISPATLISIAVKPSQLSGGTSAAGTATLSGPAGAGGAVVSLQSNSSSVTVPASVTVTTGATSATFAVQSVPVSSTTTVTLTGTYLGLSQTATLTLTAVNLVGLSVSPSTVEGGSASTGTVTLSGPAPAGGVVVSLTSGNIAATVPASVTVAVGATSATFNISTTPVATSAAVTLTAGFNGTSQSALLNVQSPLLVSVGIAPASIVGGNVATGTVTLARSAPAGGATISLGASNTTLGVQASVTVPAGSSTSTFGVATAGVAVSETDTVTATLRTAKVSAAVTVLPASLASLTISPNSVVGGNSATATLSLNGKAPSGGAVVPLTSSVASVLVPTSVTIPSGSSQSTFSVQTKPVATTIGATISAQVNSISVSGTLTVQAPTLHGITASSSTVVGGSTQMLSGSVTLTGATGGSAGVVLLKSSNPKLLAVPASVTIPAGGSNAPFSIRHFKSSSLQSVTLTATFAGTSQSVAVQVQPFAITSVTLAPAVVVGGNKVSGTVTLNATPATSTGPIMINLSSSVKSATVPSLAYVKVNTNSVKFNVATSAVKTSVSAALTASTGTSAQTGSLKILPASLLNLTVAPVSVKGSGSTAVTGTITLSGPAPTGGLAISLGSSSSSASVPHTVVIAAGRTVGTFRVTHKAVSSTVTVVITASLASTSLTANLKLTP